jgi:hypothetical protein
VSLSISPQTVDVTSGEQAVSVVVSLKDASGIGSANFWFRRPEFGLFKRKTSSSGWVYNSQTENYDNTFTFYPGNQLKLDLGAIYCPSLDQPLLDLGQDFAYQQYVVVDEPGQTNPYVLITTPGGLFAPQRMYMMNFDQEDASLSTKYGSDSINMKVKAL